VYRRLVNPDSRTQCCGSGTVGIVTFCHSGTGTVIQLRTLAEPEPYKMESQKFSQTQYKIVYLISFILHFFHSHFPKNFMKLIHFFPCKKAYYVKMLDFFHKSVFENCFFWSRQGAQTGTGTRTVTCQKSEPEP
jgi:hypothetical protein